MDNEFKFGYLKKSLRRRKLVGTLLSWTVKLETLESTTLSEERITKTGVNDLIFFRPYNLT